MLPHKMCTGLFTILMALPFTSHADETETDETRADKVFEYFDKDGDGVLNNSEKATAKCAHNVVDYHDDGSINRVEFRRARRVHNAADYNDDGEIGPREANRAKRFHEAADYNDDGKVSRKEYKRAGKVHNAVDKMTMEKLVQENINTPSSTKTSRQTALKAYIKGGICRPSLA